ncbi:hypothetical protein [Desulfotalea psychrophila]|uniref:Uncharacterized protein n=1 Tax=Desulfotalea psychrophila (strain LSv54 / DSM 12343) TaxID=177439 RepID=Q6ALK1_DESPS|nr:hypothetical protein [Desulfotalea psychrophila]CAG36774.1 unknown protein [Desulfotalea psychrophila LSv54]
MNNLKKFCAICSEEPKKVAINRQVSSDASNILGLHTKEAIKAFVGDGGIETPTYINSKIWEKNPNPENKMTVYAYSFTSLHEQLYLAFFHNYLTGFWVLKSLHKTNNPNPTLGSIFDQKMLNQNF